jgi:hypothetical protein
VIANKIANSIGTLETVIPESRPREIALSRLRREYEPGIFS